MYAISTIVGICLQCSPVKNGFNLQNSLLGPHATYFFHFPHAVALHLLFLLFIVNTRAYQYNVMWLRPNEREWCDGKLWGEINEWRTPKTNEWTREKHSQKIHSHENIKTANKKTKVMDMIKYQTWFVMMLLLLLLPLLM